MAAHLGRREIILGFTRLLHESNMSPAGEHRSCLARCLVLRSRIGGSNHAANAWGSAGHCHVNFAWAVWSRGQSYCADHVACRAHVSWSQSLKASDGITR
jgi:hypothetical protein